MAAFSETGHSGRQATKVFAMLIMDRSSSMQRFADAPLRAINSYLQRLQESNHAELLEASVVVFDHATDTLISMRPVSQIQPLQKYTTGRGTRLHGTVADVIERLTQRVLVEQGQGVSVSASVTVFTDGEDTSHPAGKHLSRLRRSVVEAGDLGFQLIAVGIGIDGVALAKELWFPVDRASTVDPDGIEILKAAHEVSQLVNDFSAQFTADELPKVTR